MSSAAQWAAPPARQAVVDVAVAIDVFPLPIAIVTRGRVVQRNPALDRLMRSEPGERQLMSSIVDIAQQLSSSPLPIAASDPWIEQDVWVGGARYLLWAVRAAAVARAPRHVLVLVRRVHPRTLADRQAAASTLTPREAEVGELIARGLTGAEIAAALGISRHTVQRHTERVFEKLAVHTRAAVGARLRGE